MKYNIIIFEVFCCYFCRYKQRQQRLLDEEDEIELGYAPTLALDNSSNFDVSMINLT